MTSRYEPYSKSSVAVPVPSPSICSNNRETILPCVPHGAPLQDFRSLRTTLRIPPTWSEPLLSFRPEDLPPLLPIPSSSLAIQARTHRSSHSLDYINGGNMQANSCERELGSYEVLESLGDRKVNAVVYAVLNHHFPFLVSAALSVRSSHPLNV